MTVKPAGRGIEVLCVYSFFVGLTTIFAVARVYCRLCIQKAFGWDDWFAVLAWALFTIFAAFAMTGVHHGTGQHADAIKPPSEIPIALKFWWLCEPAYVLSTMAVKACIAFMLLRLCVRPVHKVIVWIALAAAEIYSAFFFFLFLFQCSPSNYFWTQYTGATGTCINPEITVSAMYGYSAVSCVTDWTFSILPAFLVWNLQLGTREKFSVILILGMGALASTATIARIPYVDGLHDQADFLYATTDVAIWSCCETGLGIAAACCATLRPLIRRLLPSLAFTSSNQRSDAGPSGLRHGASTAGHDRRRSHRGYERAEDLKLVEMERAKGFGTLTSVWHSDDEQDIETGSSSSKMMIINTQKSIHRIEEKRAD